MQTLSLYAKDGYLRQMLLAALLIFGLLLGKVWLLGEFGGGAPYWDQWDAEAAHLYKPWVESNFSPVDLVRPHNEHRILTSRIVHLLLFEALGQRWDPRTQMYLNAVLHVTAIMIFLLFAGSAPFTSPLWPMWAFSAALFSLPFGWENTLSGFQTPFYLQLLLGFAVLWISAFLQPRGFNAAAMVTGSILLLVTMASGALAVMAAAFVLLVRRILLGEKIPLLLLGALVALSLAGILATPVVEAHGGLKAWSPVKLWSALAALGAWPAVTAPTSAAIATMLALLMQAPLAWALFASYRIRTTDPRSFLFFVAMASWFALQVAALAYGRAADCLASRYLDVLCFGVATNFAALLYLRTKVKGRWSWVPAALAVVWMAALANGVWNGIPKLRADLETKASRSLIQERNVRGYLLTGEPRWLFDAEHLEIPYPKPDRLRQLLDDETIRRILPRELFDTRSEDLQSAPARLREAIP